MTKDQNKDIRAIESEHDFESKAILIQRILLVPVVTFLIAGLLGVFGDGILSSKKVENDAFLIEYDQYLRQDTPTKISVYLKNSRNNTAVSINRDYIEKVKIREVTPQPRSVAAEYDQLVYAFNATQGGLITFYLIPMNTGMKTLELTVQGEKKLLKQYVYF